MTPQDDLHAPPTPDEERADLIEDLQFELEHALEQRALNLHGPNPAGRAARALDRFFKWPRVTFSWLALIGVAVAAYIFISRHPVVPVAAAAVVYAAMFAIGYVWETVSARRHWRQNRAAIIAEFDAEISEIRNELFRLGVRATGPEQRGASPRRLV